MNASYASATVIAQDTTEKDQRRYLIDALYTAYQSAKSALEVKFGITDENSPSTLSELVKRIQDGQFVLPEKYKDKPHYACTSYLRWRDPKTVEDKAGFDVAKAALKKARDAAERIITIKAPADGLTALEDFEAAQAPKAK